MQTALSEGLYSIRVKLQKSPSLEHESSGGRTWVVIGMLKLEDEEDGNGRLSEDVNSGGMTIKTGTERWRE